MLAMMAGRSAVVHDILIICRQKLIIAFRTERQLILASLTFLAIKKYKHLHPTQPHRHTCSKIRPNSTQSNPTHGWTQLMSISGPNKTFEFSDQILVFYPLKIVALHNS